MTILSFFRELYSLDTLDTRFTTSASTPLKVASDNSAKTATEDDKPPSQLPTGASPSRWNTPEFYFYLLVFIFCIPNMYWSVVEVSQPTSPNYQKYEHLLSDGWLFGRKVDNSDGQYAGFRDNIPYLAILLVIHPLLRRVYESMAGTTQPMPTANGTSKVSSSDVASEKRLRSRLNFDFVFALVFIAALHGFSALKVLLILHINFTMIMGLPRRYIPAATWIFNISMLFANELARGYPYASIMATILPTHAGATDLGKFFDS